MRTLQRYSTQIISLVLFALTKAALVRLPKVVIIAIRIKENRSLHQELSLEFKLRLLNHTFLHIAITNTELIGFAADLCEVFESGLLVYQFDHTVRLHV